MQGHGTLHTNRTEVFARIYTAQKYLRGYIMIRTKCGYMANIGEGVRDFVFTVVSGL